MTGDTRDAEALKRSAILRGLFVVWDLVREFLHYVLVVPYREGRLRAQSWPAGLRVIVVVAIIGYVLAVLGIVMSGALRNSLELSVTVGAATPLSLPRPLLWVLQFLVVFSVSMLQTAAIHIGRWWAVIVTTLTVLILLFMGGIDSDGLWSPGHVATIAASVAIIALTVMRRRTKFAWWEFVIIMAIIGIAFAVATGRAAVEGAASGIDFGPTMLSLTMSVLGELAVPVAIAAGIAVAQLSSSTALWAVGLVRRKLPKVALYIGLSLVILWRAIAFVTGLQSGDNVALAQILASLALVVVIAALWYWQSTLRGRSREVPSALNLVERLGEVSTPIAAGLSATLGPIVIALLLSQILLSYRGPLSLVSWLNSVVTVLSTSTAIAIVRFVIGVALIVLSLFLARRGKTTSPELYAAIGLVTVTIAIAGYTNDGNWLWSSGGLTVVATVACVALVAWFAVRRQLSRARVTGLTVALLLAAFFDQRDFVSDPLGALLGFTGVAFVLFGFLWSFLTSGGFANENSSAFPRPARVLVFLAYSVFSVTVLAFTALARNPDATTNLGSYAAVGDELFGTALVAATFLSVLSSVGENRVPSLEETVDVASVDEPSVSQATAPVDA